MRGIFVTFAVILCVSHLAFGEDVTEMKKKILKKMDEYLSAASKGYSDMSHYFNNRVYYLDTIQEQKGNLGESLSEMFAYEVKKIAEGTEQKTFFTSSTPKVMECIKEKKEKALKKLETIYTNSFVKPLGDLRQKGREREQHISNRWSHEYFAGFEVLKTQISRNEEEIKNTKNKVYLQSLLKHVEKVFNSYIVKVYSLPKMYHENEIQFDRTIEKGILRELRATGRKFTENFQEEVDTCLLVV